MPQWKYGENMLHYTGSRDVTQSLLLAANRQHIGSERWLYAVEHASGAQYKGPDIFGM